LITSVVKRAAVNLDALNVRGVAGKSPRRNNRARRGGGVARFVALVSIVYRVHGQVALLVNWMAKRPLMKQAPCLVALFPRADKSYRLKR